MEDMAAVTEAADVTRMSGAERARRSTTPVRLAAFVVALALACVSAAFSIDGLTAIFAELRNYGITELRNYGDSARNSPPQASALSVRKDRYALSMLSSSRQTSAVAAFIKGDYSSFGSGSIGEPIE